jgi:hypothetical protein
MPDQLHGRLAETPDGDIHDYGDHPDHPDNRASATVNVCLDPWLSDVLLAAGALLGSVEEEAVLVSDDIREHAAELRRVLERREA